VAGFFYLRKVRDRHKLYQGLLCINAFWGIIVNGCHEELGIDKMLGVRVDQCACLARLWGYNELHEDDAMAYAMPEHMVRWENLARYHA